MNETVLNAFVYGRVSTKGKQNVETQLNAIKDYCQRNNITVIGEFIDQGISGSKESRPQLNAMLEGLRGGQSNIVICYKLDRLARSLKHLTDIMFEFRNKGIRVISISDGIDTIDNNPMSQAFWQLMGVFAEFELAIIRERVNSGLERARNEGKTLGRPKGSKDKRDRAKSGYYLRYAGRTRKQREIG